MTFYLDSSAIVKLAVAEAESIQLRAFLAGKRLVSSAIARPESIRAARRVDPQAALPVLVTLSEMSLMVVNDRVLDRAAALAPVSLRTLDAIHVATALLLEDDLDALATYDRRMAAAAAAAGIRVVAPA